MKKKVYKYPHPHDPTKMVSRQRVKQILNEDAGVCRQCSQPVAPGSQFCLLHSVILRLRGRMRQKPKVKRHPTAWKENKPDLSGADWRLPIGKIAAQYKTSKGVVQGYMRKHNIPIRPVGQRSKILDWSGVNWAQSNKAIAVELGAYSGTVLKKRKELGIQTWRQMKHST